MGYSRSSTLRRTPALLSATGVVLGFTRLILSSNAAIFHAMSAKAQPAGWVVQATIAAPPAPPSLAGAKWVGDKMPGAPSFEYFNVAVADPNKAVEATAQYLTKAKVDTAGGLSAVRELSSAEVSALLLKAGEVKPA
jgi:hypothetical protein